MGEWLKASVSLDSAELRAQFRYLPSPVVAVCAIIDGAPVGMVMSSFTSVSLDPPLASFCPALTSRTWPKLRQAPRLGISLLGADQEAACRALAAGGAESLPADNWIVTPDGAAFLSQSTLQLEAVIESTSIGGDHEVVLVRLLHGVVEAEREPMIFYRGAYVSPRVDSFTSAA